MGNLPLIVLISGPPGAGKSTLAVALVGPIRAATAEHRPGQERRGLHHDGGHH